MTLSPFIKYILVNLIENAADSNTIRQKGYSIVFHEAFEDNTTTMNHIWSFYLLTLFIIYKAERPGLRMDLPTLQ